ncbi:MAG: SH3 domain-containing protein [Anaerolineae bacterium]|nr:SH3 domain-containing protein [Anaerolineae bacterium]
MKHLRILIWTCLLVLATAPILVLAQDCPATVTEALATTDQVCDSTGRNRACYGYMMVEADPQPGIDDFAFTTAGDQVDVASIQSMRLSPMQVDTGMWGVALMRLQANLPETRTHSVTLLAFGDVSLENSVPVPTFLDMTVAVDSYVNVRRLPNAAAGVVGVLEPGQTVTAVQRLADDSWLRVELPNYGEQGWVLADLLTTDSDLNTLNIAEASQPGLRPMQAFYFQSGNDAISCDAVPESGMLIQTPEGVGEIRLWINEVKIDMGSTIHFQAQANGDMVISALEGHATVEARGVQYTAMAGTQIIVPMDTDLKPSGSPSLPTAYDDARFKNLPISLLERQITIHAPLTPEELETVLDDLSTTTDASIGTDGSTCPPVCDAADPLTCPGNSCDPCPGQSCDQGNKDGNNGQGDGSGTGGGNSNAGGNGNGNGNGGGNGGGNGNGG